MALFRLASWKCKGLPRQRSVADTKVWPAALELKHGLNSQCEAAVKSFSQWTRVWGCYAIFNETIVKSIEIINSYIFIMKEYKE